VTKEIIITGNLLFFYLKGTVNILSVGGFVGHVMKIECVFDNSQGDKKG